MCVALAERQNVCAFSAYDQFTPASTTSPTNDATGVWTYGYHHYTDQAGTEVSSSDPRGAHDFGDFYRLEARYGDDGNAVDCTMSAWSSEWDTSEGGPAPGAIFVSRNTNDGCIFTWPHHEFHDTTSVAYTVPARTLATRGSTIQGNTGVAGAIRWTCQKETCGIGRIVGRFTAADGAVPPEGPPPDRNGVGNWVGSVSVARVEVWKTSGASSVRLFCWYTHIDPESPETQRTGGFDMSCIDPDGDPANGYGNDPEPANAGGLDTVRFQLGAQELAMGDRLELRVYGPPDVSNNGVNGVYLQSITGVEAYIIPR